MRRSKRMMRRRPALALFVPLEHGKIRDPEEAEIFSWIAALLESTMPVSIFLRQRQTQQPCSRINRVVVLLNLRFHAACGFMLCRFTIAGNDHNQVIRFCASFLSNLGSSFGKVFLQPLEIFE